MTLVTPRKPGGFNEYLPGEQIEYNRLRDIIRAKYEKYGFTPLDTPDLELTEVLLAKGGGETEQQVYTFKRQGSDTSLTMRYDLTVPLARYVAEHESELVFPFRRYHLGKVHRAERQQKGRFREFEQDDIDVIGSYSPIIDAEFPAIINEIFEEFGFGEFTIRLNNRLILNGFFEGIGLASVSRDVLRTIDKMEKITPGELVAELTSIGLDASQVERVLDFTTIAGSNDDILAALKGLGIESEHFDDGVTKLGVLIDALRVMGVPESRFQIDLKIARGLDYYTGTVYETILNDYPEVGSVCSGGRYDDLAGYYTKTALPGVGISIGLSRLFSKLREVPGLIQTTRQSPADVVVMPINDAQNGYGISVAATLRNAGIATMLYTEPDSLKDKLRYANRMGFAYVVLVGEAEAKAGTVTVKDMAARSESTGTVEAAVQLISVR
ncbi:MAG: histidine--tRNA ligase [Candidatus Microsaccharimonas sp.]